jgi:hypothetical protein
MSDVAGAAPAAAESTPAPVDEQIVDVPNPVETVDTTPAAPKEPAKPPSIREALDKAEKTVQAKQEAKPEAKAEAKPEQKAAPKEAKPEQPRENGKFVAKDKPADSAAPADATAAKTEAEAAPSAKSTYEAPKRFSEDAKKVWDTSPDPVKAEVSRMEREMTQGIEKHRAKAERDDSIAEFHDMAAKSGTTVKAALARYTGMENKLRGDLIGGLDEIVGNASNGKLSLRDVAAHIMGQTPEQNQSQSDATIRELKQTVARLQEQVGGVTQSIAKQHENSTLQEVTKFASEKGHERFEELAEDIGFFMQSGRAKDLSEAYTLAERLNPAPAQATAEVPKAADASAKVTDLAEQIRKGAKSPTGAPSAGSDPATNKRPSKTIRGSLDRAFQQAGF